MKKKKKERNVIISLDIKEGCGINYGVCYPTDSHIEIPCNLEKLGITIYEMLTKEMPYYESSTLRVIY
jgi:hypothetical protein